MGVSRSFSDKVAALIGAPSDRTFEILNQWEPWENANADYNPLATTQHAPGSRPLGGNPGQNGGNPVQEYPSEDVGAKATADTLLYGGGGYPATLQWLRTGQLDPTSVSKEIGSKWGTTGFANQIAGGKVAATSTGGTVPAPPATSTAAGGSKADQAVALWQQFMAQKPTPVGPDDPGYPDYTVAMDAWVKTMTQLGDIAKSLQTSEGKRDTGFDQQLSAFNAQVTATHYQNADALASAQASNTRDLGGMNVGTQRAQTALQEAELLSKWGVPKSGAQDFSYHDLLGGAGDAWANLLGTDPSASAYHVLGTGHIDTGGTAAAMDKQLGVGGPLAQIPNFLNVPEGAGMPTPPAQTTPGDNGISFNDAIAQISGSGGIPLPQGYGSTAGLGDAETPANAKPKPVTNGIFDPMATLKALFPGITLGSGLPATGATTDRPIDWTKPASAYGGNNATRFLWGDNPATAQQSPNLLSSNNPLRNAMPNWFNK